MPQRITLPGGGQGLEDGHNPASLGQIEGGGEPGGSVSVDRDPPGAGVAYSAFGGDLVTPLVEELGREVMLEPADGDGVALVGGGAARLALVGADPAADVGEGVGPVEEPQALLIVAVADGGDVSGNRCVGGAGGDTEAAGDAAVGLGPGLLDAVPERSHACHCIGERPASTSLAVKSRSDSSYPLASIGVLVERLARSEHIVARGLIDPKPP